MRTFCLIFLSLISILAAKGQAAPAPKPKASAETIIRTEVTKADADWVPIDWEPVKIAPGTALDFSVFADAPAGKHGALICHDGYFAFQDNPDKPARFYGLVMGHGLPFMDKAHIDQLADYLAACGYNIVRFHNYLFQPDVMKTVGSNEFNPARLDQLEYLFAALKKRGIYFTFPLNSWPFFKAGVVTDVPEFVGKDFRFESNGLLPISPDLQNWMKQYTANLLGHVNPYTGLALKDDPALVSIEMGNESSLFAVLSQFPVLVPIYKERCAAELKAKLGRDPSAQEIDQEMPHYIVGLQENYYQMMKGYLRGMGVQKPLTDLNFRNNMIYALPRAKLDYVDLHHYWALYRKLPGPPGVTRVALTNPLTVNWSTFLGTAPGRMFGLPFDSSEFNSDYPTPYWIFMGPVEATLAGSQGWSAVMRCGLWTFPDVAFSQSPLQRIESGHSPVQMLSERIGSLLFVQNQIQPLATKVPIALTSDYLYAHANLLGGPLYPLTYSDLAFKYRLGTVLADQPGDFSGYPAFVTPADMAKPAALGDAKVVTEGPDLASKLAGVLPAETTPPAYSADAQKGSAQIITPKSESFLLPAEVDSAQGNVVSVSGNATVSVSFAGSLDGQPLAASHKVLALYLTDVHNTGSQLDYTSDHAVIVRQIGTAPLLVHQGKITMTFHAPGRPLPEVWALKYDGTHAVSVPVQKTDTGFSFDAQAVTNAQTFSAFELDWKN